jgi:chromosome segregation ATPase
MNYKGETELEEDLMPADSGQRVAVLQQELERMRLHVNTLQRKLHNPPASPPPVPSKPPAKLRKSHSRKERSQADQLIADIHTSEKELTRLQHSLSHSPGRIPNVAVARQIDSMREGLAEERRRTARLQAENESLKERLRKREELQQEIAHMQEEYNALTVSFDRSEEIRRKQKLLIEELRAQLGAPLEEDSEPSDRQLKPPTLTVKRRKSKAK